MAGYMGKEVLTELETLIKQRWFFRQVMQDYDASAPHVQSMASKGLASADYHIKALQNEHYPEQK